MESTIQTILSFILLVALSRAASLVSRRIAFPSLGVQLLLGILVGLFLLNPPESPVLPGTWGSAQPNPLFQILKVLAEIGLIQLMFLAGLRTDWTGLKKAFGSAFSLGGGPFVASAAGAAIVARFFVDGWPEALALASVMGVSSIGMALYSLREKNQSNSRVTSLVVASSLLSWGLGILLMVSGLALKYSSGYGALRALVAASWLLGQLIMYFAVSYFLMSRYLRWSGGKGPEKRVWHRVVGYFLLVASLYAWAAMHFGSFAAAAAAFLGGSLLIHSHPEWKERVGQTFESFLGSLPIGLFFLILGMEVDLREFAKWANPFAVVTATVVIAKIAATRIAASRVLQPSRERLQVISAILPPGEIGIVIATYLFSRGLVSPSMFDGTVAALVALTLITSFMVKGSIKGATSSSLA